MVRIVSRCWFVASGLITLLLSGCSRPLTVGEIHKQVGKGIVLITYADAEGNGSGFLVTGKEGVCTVLTARHVVALSSNLKLQTYDGKLYNSTTIQKLRNQDLALITFETGGENCLYKALELGDSDKVNVGDDIYITGFPGGSSRSQFVRGPVSLLDQLADGYGISYAVITAGGMSGGPVVNTAGKVIAVHGRSETELIKRAELTNGKLPPQQQSAQGINSAEGDTQTTFKWSIPINVYLKNKTDIFNEVIANSNAAKTAKYWIGIGNDLYTSKQYEEAIASYNKAIQFQPNDAQAYYNRGVVLRELKRYEEAIASLDKAIQFRPDYANAYTNRGYALRQLKRYEEAIASYDKAIQFQPDDANAYYSRGNTLLELKRYEEAITSYDKAIQFKSDFANAWTNRGNALYELKRYQEALASNDKAIQFHSDHTIASNDKAIQFQSDHAIAWNNRGNALVRLKRYEEALASYDKAIQFQPNYAQAYHNRGHILDDSKRYEEAIAFYDKAIQFQPDYADAYYSRGRGMYFLQRYEEAIASYDKAIQFQPDYADAWTGRGIALEKLKRYEEAIASYNKAISIKPDHQLAINNRKELLTQVRRSK